MSSQLYALATSCNVGASAFSQTSISFNSACPSEEASKSNIIIYILFQLAEMVKGAPTEEDVVLIVAGTCSVFAVILSSMLIRQHLIHFSRPVVQVRAGMAIRESRYRFSPQSFFCVHSSTEPSLVC